MLRPPNRKLIAFAIIGFWLIMMALFVRREMIKPFFGRNHVRTFVNRETDTWMALYMNKGDAVPEDATKAGENVSGVRVGVVNTQTRPEIRHGEYGQSMRFWMNMSLTLLSFPMELSMSGDAWASRDEGLREFEISVRASEHAMRISATVSDGVLEGKVHTAGETIPLNIPIGKDLLLSGTMGTAALNVPGLTPGDEVYVDTFDPMTLAVSKAKLSCLGEETVRYGGEDVKTKVIATTIGGMTSKAWVSYDDEVLRAETPFGMTLERITRQEALTAVRPEASGELVGNMGIKPTGQRPTRGAAFMQFRLSGVPEDVTLPEDDTQSRGGSDRYIIRVPEAPLPGSVQPSEDAMTPFLESDAFVQANHPKIQAQALEIVGDETDPWQRALRLYQWVYDNVTKTIVMSVPSALDVLKTKEGDCNEHTVLYTALARAVGIPTRIAIGIVWSDEMGGFYYHAWPEVYMGRWIWMDPTLGQPIADATHIKLLTGSIDKWSQLLRFLGQIQVEVLDVGSAPGASAEK